MDFNGQGQMIRLKRITWMLAALPILVLAAEAFTGGLGANPIQALTRALGDWSLRFLLLTLAVTPVRMLTGWGRVAALRRTFGLITFTYACLHLVSYVGLDLFFDWPSLWKDLVKRQFITVGMAAYLILIPLAVTSHNAVIKRMGMVRWRVLHRTVYVIPPLVILHFFMMIKAGYDRPTLYGFVAVALLVMRVVRGGARHAQEET